MDFIRLASESRKPHGTTGHYGGILSPHLIKVDESTRRMDKLAFARLCIEVFRDLKLPSSISIVLQGSRNINPIPGTQSEWFPSIRTKSSISG